MLASNPLTHYTIQLALMQQADNVENFYRLFSLRDQVHHYRMQMGDKLFFVLIYGDYPTYDENKTAAEALPEEVHKQGPWICRYKTLQKDYRNPEIAQITAANS